MDMSPTSMGSVSGKEYTLSTSAGLGFGVLPVRDVFAIVAVPAHLKPAVNLVHHLPPCSKRRCSRR